MQCIPRYLQLNIVESALCCPCLEPLFSLGLQTACIQYTFSTLPGVIVPGTGSQPSHTASSEQAPIHFTAENSISGTDVYLMFTLRVWSCWFFCNCFIACVTDPIINYCQCHCYQWYSNHLCHEINENLKQRLINCINDTGNKLSPVTATKYCRGSLTLVNSFSQESTQSCEYLH